MICYCDQLWLSIINELFFVDLSRKKSMVLPWINHQCMWIMKTIHTLYLCVNTWIFIKLNLSPNRYEDAGKINRIKYETPIGILFFSYFFSKKSPLSYTVLFLFHSFYLDQSLILMNRWPYSKKKKIKWNEMNRKSSK